MKVHVDCHGCEQRELDAERVINYLKANGIEISNSPSAADSIIYVTCAVDTANEKQSLQGLERLASEKAKDASIIVGGCLPSISPEKLKDFNVAATFSPRTMESLDSIFTGKISVLMSQIPEPNKTRFDKTAKSVLEDSLSPRDEYEIAKSGFKIRVNQGCLLSCSYCVIKEATARLSSTPWDNVITQFEEAVDRGEPTIMLMGGDTGAYGYDTGTRFHKLLMQLISTEGDYKLFVHDFNVNWLLRDMDGYKEVFQYNDNVGRLRTLDLPVQSGSNRILRAMKRPYKTEDVIDGLTYIRRQHPSIHMGTHIIIGFPGEEEADFRGTLRLLAQVDFDFVTAFAYSEHSRAASSNLPEKNSYETIAERATRMKDFLGDRVKVLGV
ncbi:radical SAM protein [Candidatus Woesearchaeota archaeon]|nr:radical SAM protein [Candidatus Woesearchaeota archaeon]